MNHFHSLHNIHVIIEKRLQAFSVHRSVSARVLLVNLYIRATVRVPATLAIENKAERLP